jgi:hypothetical protein
VVEVEKYQDYAIRVYLLMVVGWTIFTDTSKNSVHLTYLGYFEELESVVDYVWGGCCADTPIQGPLYYRYIWAKGGHMLYDTALGNKISQIYVFCQLLSNC